MSIKIHGRTPSAAVAAGVALVASVLTIAVPQAGAATPKLTQSGKALRSGVTLRGAIVPRTNSAHDAITIVWVTKLGTGPATCYYSDGSTANEGEQATLMVSYTGADGETHWVTAEFVCGPDGKWHGK